jgi:hypothetical protein
MVSVFLRQNDVMGVRIVELVDLVAPVVDRQVPLEQIDKDRLARREHRPHDIVADQVRLG